MLFYLGWQALKKQAHSSLEITEKNHYNPCFWTAFWNFDYLQNKRKGSLSNDKPRDQKIFSLNLKSNKILSLKTRNVFVEKGAGLAVIKKEDALSFYKRMHPQKLEELKEYYKTNPSELILDFENHFTGFENLYKEPLERAIINGTINCIEDKVFLSFFIMIQVIRNHNHLKGMEFLFESIGQKKFEMFYNLKHTLSDTNELMKLIEPFFVSKWVVYKTSDFKFPLSDNPVLIRPLHILIPLGPDLLLEIDLKKKVSVSNFCTAKHGIPFWTYLKFRKRTIENSSREIIFGEASILARWQKSRLYKKHLEKM